MPLLRQKSNDAYLYWADQVLRRLKGLDPDGAPSFAYIEPSTGCNLKCPACVTGTAPDMRTRKQASLEDYKVILDSLGDRLIKIDLYNWGEPFLNKNLPIFTKMASDRSIHTSLSTNFSFPKMEGRIDAVLDAGLNSLKVGLDGASQAVHDTYRRGANLGLVKANLEYAARVRDRHNYPIRIYAAFLVFEHSVHELQDVFDFCESIGVELEINQTPFTSPRAGIHASAAASADIRHYWREQITSGPLPAKRCSWLHHAVVVNPNLSVSPCCAVADERDDFAFLERETLGQDIGEILRHDSWRDARGFFDGKSEEAIKDILLKGAALDDDTPGMGNTAGDDFICARCPIGTEAFKYHFISHNLQAMLLAEVAHSPVRDEEDKFALFYKVMICTVISEFSARPASETRLAELEAALVLLRALTDPAANPQTTAQSFLTLAAGTGSDAIKQVAKLLYTPVASIAVNAPADRRGSSPAVRAQVAQIMAQHHAAQAPVLRSVS